MSKLEYIKAFISVVEQNSFAAAARKYGVSTALMSRQVARLEADLKVALLQRTTRQLSLTEVGSEYYQLAKKIVAELEAAEVAISVSRGEPTGILSVVSSRYFAIKYLLPLMPTFMAQYPALRVKVELAERFPDLAQENVDVVFGVSIEGPPELVRRRIATTRYILCASPAYLEKFGIPQVPADLSQHRYITHSMRRPDNVVTFKNNKEIYVEPILWLNDSRAMCECAIQGIGIVRLHDYIVNEALEDGRLVEVLPQNRDSSQPVYLYYQQSRYLHPKIRCFIDFYTSQNNKK